MKLYYPLLKFALYLIILLANSRYIVAQTLEEKEWIVEGNKFYNQKEYDKASAAYSKVLATAPSSYKAHFNLGNTFYNLKEYSKAAAHFHRAIDNTNDKLEKANAFHNLGNSQMQLGSFKNAMEAYKDALRNNPKDHDTRYNFLLAKKLLDIQNKQQNPPNLPRPSDYAKEIKQKADTEANKGNFKIARKLMLEALDKDSTVVHYQNYIDKLTEIVILDTIKLK